MIYRRSFYMLKGIKQTDKELLKPIQDYGCLFLCFANASPLIFEGNNGRQALNNIWKQAEKKGYITGDLNGDGDYDEADEAMLMRHTELARELFALPVHYDDKHHKADEEIPENVSIIFGKYTYKYSHFVQLNRQKKVIFDSLGNSNTV
jgi:hypothetical protein